MVGKENDEKSSEFVRGQSAGFAICFASGLFQFRELEVAVTRVKGRRKDLFGTRCTKLRLLIILVSTLRRYYAPFRREVTIKETARYKKGT